MSLSRARRFAPGSFFGRTSVPAGRYQISTARSGLIARRYATIVNNDIASKAYGVVGTPFPASWARDGNLVQRWLSPIKLVWNYSENNRATGAGLFYTGAEPKAPFATTTDYAVRYSIPGGKAYFEFRRYFTENLGNLSTMANGTQIQDIWINLGYTDPAKTAFASNQYRDTSDRDLSGTEVTRQQKYVPRSACPSDHSGQFAGGFGR